MEQLRPYHFESNSGAPAGDQAGTYTAQNTPLRRRFPRSFWGILSVLTTATYPLLYGLIKTPSDIEYIFDFDMPLRWLVIVLLIWAYHIVSAVNMYRLLVLHPDIPLTSAWHVIILTGLRTHWSFLIIGPSLPLVWAVTACGGHEVCQSPELMSLGWKLFVFFIIPIIVTSVFYVLISAAVAAFVFRFMFFEFGRERLARFQTSSEDIYIGPPISAPNPPNRTAVDLNQIRQRSYGRRRR